LRVRDWSSGVLEYWRQKHCSNGKLVADVNEVVPLQKAYDFSFARQAEQQLNKEGWKP